MNKSELIELIAEKADLPKAGASRALDAILESITDSLAKGEPVVLLGFGTFSVKERAARQGRNPKTGEAIEIQASKVPAFKPGKAFKDALNVDMPVTLPHGSEAVFMEEEAETVV